MILDSDPPPSKWSALKVWSAGEDEDRQMGTKRRKPEDVVAELRRADVLIAQGESVADVILTLGVIEVT